MDKKRKAVTRREAPAEWPESLGYWSLEWFLNKAKKTSLQLPVPENLDNNEDPKRDIHTSNLHWK